MLSGEAGGFSGLLSAATNVNIAQTNNVSELVVSNGVTLGGVRRTAWPSGGSGPGTDATQFQTNSGASQIQIKGGANVTNLNIFGGATAAAGGNSATITATNVALAANVNDAVAVISYPTAVTPTNASAILTVSFSTADTSTHVCLTNQWSAIYGALGILPPGSGTNLVLHWLFTWEGTAAGGGGVAADKQNANAGFLTLTFTNAPAVGAGPEFNQLTAEGETAVLTAPTFSVNNGNYTTGISLSIAAGSATSTRWTLSGPLIVAEH